MVFLDKKNNEIDIDWDDDDVIANYEGNEIGRIQFDCRDEGIVLYHMNVNSEFHRSGIAVEMMKLAVQTHGDSFGKPSFLKTGGECHEYYTQEGSAFIRHCISIGLLKDTENKEEYDADFY
jgi:hypothetical protein